MEKGLGSYYITPSRDFIQYTRDYEEKYWNRYTAFDWGQDVVDNLQKHLDGLSEEEFLKILLMAAPLIHKEAESKIAQLQAVDFPVEEDVILDIGDYLPSACTSLSAALDGQELFKTLRSSISTQSDRLDIISRQIVDIKEKNRLGLVDSDSGVKILEHPEERDSQKGLLNQLNGQKSKIKLQLKETEEQYIDEKRRITENNGESFQSIKLALIKDLKETSALFGNLIETKKIPIDPSSAKSIREILLKRQLRALKDISNHALVVEQSAIAPLTMGIIHYKRHREIQEAMTTFIHDEAKHSATFRRYLAEKLKAKEFVSSKIVTGSNRYMLVAKVMPGAGMFMAVAVESIGASSIEFFGDEKYMPEPLFSKICRTISTQDEVRHIGLCVDIYNELYRRNSFFEKTRNQIALKTLIKSVYADKNVDHRLVRAFQVFGVKAEQLYYHIMEKLSIDMAKIGMNIQPEYLLKLLGQKV